MQHFTCVLWNEGVYKYLNILGHVKISKPIMVYLKKRNNISTIF